MTTERVTYRPEDGRARTIYLQDPSLVTTDQLGQLLTGIEVTREGDEMCGPGFDERRHIISVDAIVRRVPVVMDNIYGEYVEAD